MAAVCRQGPEGRSGPGSKGRTLGQAAIGGAVSGKALVQDHDAMGFAVPLRHQDGSGPKAVTAGTVTSFREFVAIAGSRDDPVEELV
jgi:hypothetical protein